MSDISIIDTQASNDEAQHELAVLRVVQENERTAQRDIARRAGISLGMTNAILKRLSQKGFLTVRRIKGRHGGGIMIGGPMGHKRTLTAIIEREENMHVALCPELDVASQGRTVEDARVNLREAVELFLESADAAEIKSRFHDEQYVTSLEVMFG